MGFFMIEIDFKFPATQKAEHNNFLASLIPPVRKGGREGGREGGRGFPKIRVPF